MGRKHWALASGSGGCGGSRGGLETGFGRNSVGLADESDVRREKEGMRIALGRWATMTGKGHFLG